MNYSEIFPEGMLTEFIKYFWRFEHIGVDVEYTILPDACFDLVVDFENNILQNIYLTGIWTRPIKIVVTKGTVLFAIRFKTIASEYLIQREIKSLLNTMTTLPHCFWGLQLTTSSDFADFVIKLSQHMLNILNKYVEIDSRKLNLFSLIYREEKWSVGELSSKTGWSSRQINRYINQQIGISLKTLINMVRCCASYRCIVEGKLYPNTDFFDQSHYIKEIKRYTGSTPSELYKNKNDRFLQLLTCKIS